MGQCRTLNEKGMKDFPKTRQFVADINTMGNAITTIEFYESDRIHDLIMQKFKTYAEYSFDVLDLIKEFKEDVDTNLQGIQDGFDVWKQFLNYIEIPDYDIITFPFAEYGDRSREGREVLYWIKEICWELREQVADLMVFFSLKNNNPIVSFLCPSYYNAGDVGYRWSHQVNLDDDNKDTVIIYDADWRSMFKFTDQTTKKMPLVKLHTFLINEGVIPEDVPQEYFINCVHHAFFEDLYNLSEKKVKLHRTINEIGKRYFPKKVEDEDYRIIAAKSIGKTKSAISKGNIVDDFMDRLQEIL